MIEKISQISVQNHINMNKQKAKISHKNSFNGQDLTNLPEKRDLVLKNDKLSKMYMSNPAFEGNLDSKANVISEIIHNKILRYVKIFPEGAKMVKPLKFEAEGQAFEMLADKTKEGTNISITQFNPLYEISKDNRYESILNVGYSKSGKMTFCNLIMRNGDCCETYKYFKNYQNKCNIFYNAWNYGQERIIHKKLAFLLFNDHNWVPLTKHLTLSNSEYKFGKNFKHIINSEEVAAEPLWCTFCKITKFKDMDI